MPQTGSLYCYRKFLLSGDARTGSQASARGERCHLVFQPFQPIQFHLEQETDDRGMVRIGKYCIILAAVVSAVCALVLKW